MLIVRLVIFLTVMLVVLYYAIIIVQIVTGTKLLTHWVNMNKVWIPFYYLFKE